MKTVKNAWHQFDGIKTYLVCFAWLLYTAAGVYLGKVNLTNDPVGILLPLALMALRHGLSTETLNAIISILSSVPTKPGVMIGTEETKVTQQPIVEKTTLATPNATVTIPLEKVIEAIKQALVDAQQ